MCSSIRYNKFPLGTMFTTITKKYFSSFYSNLDGMSIDCFFSDLVLIDNEQRLLNQYSVSNKPRFNKTQTFSCWFA